MIKLFISYASEDWACAAQLHQLLVAAGYDVFMDRDPRNGIRVGEQWEKRLYERLRWADVVVCVITSAAVASTWCTAEISIALSRGSALLPVRAEPGVEHPLLRSVQYADLTVDPAATPEALVAELRRLDPDGGRGWEDDRSPFPGLRPLDVDEHQVFFGRRAEVQRLARLVRSPAERAVLLVVGPSGCGKSSLVRAGLWHVMADEPGWRTLPPILPGADPVAALVRQLATSARQLRLDWTVAQVRHQLNDTGLTGLADELLLTARARRLLIVIDQFEELLTQTPPEHRAHFAQLLVPALSGPVRVVATLRPEFLDQLLVDTALAMLPTQTETLRSLRRDALHTVIQEPAQLAGMKVDKDLVNRLVGDTDSGEALPLLAFTLAQLADGLGRGGQLSAARYEELGGVQGALSRQADKALAKASATTGRRPEEVIAGLLRLVTVDEQGRPTRWRVPRDELPELVTRELDVFVAHRLLTTDTEQGNVVIGVAHEAFLTGWAPLVQAIEKNASALRARRALEQAATEWHHEGRPSARLWERGQLAAALADTGAHLQAGEVVADRVDLSLTARDFLRASIRRDRLRRERALIVVSVLLVLALVVVGFVVIQRRAVEQQRNVGIAQQVAGKAVELRATNPALAAQLSLAAYRLALTTETRSSLLSSVFNPYASGLTTDADDVNSVAFSLDRRTLATAGNDKTVQLWDIHDPRRPNLLGSVVNGHTDSVLSVAFSPDGRILATAGNDKTARLWDIHDPHQPSPLGILTGHQEEVNSVAFSPDGHTLATASNDKTARLWDIHDPHQPSPLGTLTDHHGSVNAVAFSPDGHTLATASNDKTARLWDIRNPHQPGPLGILRGATLSVRSVAFSPEGRTLATGSEDATVWLWEISDLLQPQQLAIIPGHARGVRSVAFSPDSHTMATASADNSVRLWNISDLRHPYHLATLTGHHNVVNSVAFSPDGHTLATASNDDKNTAKLWETDVDSVATQICRNTPALTASEWGQYFPGLPYRPPCP